MSFGTKSDGDAADAAWANLIEDALGDGKPASPADFTVFQDGSNFKARNNNDGTIDASETNLATVINSVLAAGKKVYVQPPSSGTLDLGTSQILINAHGEHLCGSSADFAGASGTIFEYSGTGSPIRIYQSGLRLQNVKVSGIGVIATGSAITSATGYGIHATNVEGLRLWDIAVRDFEAGVGINITADSTSYSAGTKIYNPVTNGCKIGISADGYDGSHESNCVDVYSPIILGKAGPTADSIGFKVGQ